MYIFGRGDINIFSKRKYQLSAKKLSKKQLKEEAKLLDKLTPEEMAEAVEEQLSEEDRIKKVKERADEKIKRSKVSSGTISMYLSEISQYEPLPPEREVELAVRIEKGDKEAMKELVEANLRFVVSVAKKYQGNGLSLSDIINEGNLGLIKAAKRFDPSRGFKFISYAVWWIRQSILQALAEQSRIVRLPLNKIGSINKINKQFSALEQKFGRSPTPEEIAESLDITIEEVKQSIKNSGRHLSMDAPLSDSEDSNNMYEVMSSDSSPKPDKQLMNESLRREIERSLSTLTPLP